MPKQGKRNLFYINSDLKTAIGVRCSFPSPAQRIFPPRGEEFSIPGIMAIVGVLGCVLSMGWHTSMPSPIFNISDFGAKGDNFTSNTHAFKAAVASIKTAGVQSCN